jgi:hypothetical protein
MDQGLVLKDLLSGPRRRPRSDLSRGMYPRSRNSCPSSLTPWVRPVSWLNARTASRGLISTTSLEPTKSPRQGVFGTLHDES